MIGVQLIQRCEDLRDEFTNIKEIYSEMLDQEMEAQSKYQKSSSLLSAGGNEKFLNQEL